jgi:hypothetical protein
MSFFIFFIEVKDTHNKEIGNDSGSFCKSAGNTVESELGHNDLFLKISEGNPDSEKVNDKIVVDVLGTAVNFKPLQFDLAFNNVE